MENFKREYYKTMKRIYELALAVLRDYAAYPHNLDDLIDESKLTDRDILEYGMFLIKSGIEKETVDFVLTNMLEFASDNDEALLGRIKKEAVRCIQTGWSVHPYKILTLCSSIAGLEKDYIYDALIAYRENPSEEHFAGAFDRALGSAYERDTAADSGVIRSGESCEDAVYRIERRALESGERLRREGLLKLSDLIDKNALIQRDCFDYGIALFYDDFSREEINMVLQNIENAQTNALCKRLIRIQKEAVLSIYDGNNPRITGMILESLSGIKNRKSLYEEF
jgi:hypothetical protein